MFIYNICWYAAKHDKKCKGIHWCTNCWATAQFSGWFSRINSDAYWRYNWGGPRIRATRFALAIKQCGSIKPSYYWYAQFKIQVLARVLSVDVVVLRLRFHGCRRMLLSKPCFGPWRNFWPRKRLNSLWVVFSFFSLLAEYPSESSQVFSAQ